MASFSSAATSPVREASGTTSNQAALSIGLFFGYFGTRPAGGASGADWLPTADARTRHLLRLGRKLSTLNEGVRKRRRGWPRLRAPTASRQYCGGYQFKAPNAGYFQVRVTVKSGLDSDVVLVRRHLKASGTRSNQAAPSIGLFFGYFGTLPAGAASGADCLPTADARTRQLIASW